MGAGGLRRLPGAYLLAARPRLLRPRAPLAQRQEHRHPSRVKLFLYYIGKPRDPEANRMAADFLERSSRYASCEMREIRPDRFDPWARHPSARKIFLDPAGPEADPRQLQAPVENDANAGHC